MAMTALIPSRSRGTLYQNNQDSDFGVLLNRLVDDRLPSRSQAAKPWNAHPCGWASPRQVQRKALMPTSIPIQTIRTSAAVRSQV